MTRIVPILLACLLCAIARAESPIDVLVVGDVVVVAGVDWVAVPDAEPGDVELLLGVRVHDDLYPARNATVALRLARPLTLECYTVADDPADPQRERVTVTPELEPTRWQELTARLVAIETQLMRLEGGPAPPPPPVDEPEPLRVDPNTASFEELQRLPGIGPALAQRIIDAREHVVFREPMDLAIVKGIGAATVERLAEFLTFEDVPEEQEPAEGDEQTMSNTPFADAIVAVGTNTIPRDLILRWWPLHDTTGTSAAEEIAGDDGTYVGGVTLSQAALTPDTGASSVLFNGSNSYMEFAGTGGQANFGDAPKSIAIVFRTTDSDGVLFDTGRSTSASDHYGLYIADSKLYGQVRNSTAVEGGLVVVDTGMSVADGETHLAILSVDGSKVRVFLDGELAGEENYTTGNFNEAGWMTRVGYYTRDIFGVTYYGGYAEHAVIFSKALMVEDAATLWSALQGGGEPEPSTSRDIFRGRNFTQRNFTASRLRSGY